MKAVILAAGEGTRMRPLTHNRPKVMLPVGGVPMLERLLRQLVMAGVEDVTLVVHYHADRVRDHFGDGGDVGATIRYAEQGAARGTGHAALVGLDALGAADEHVLLLNGDLFVGQEDIEAVVDAAADGPVVSGAEVEDPREYGVLILEGGRPVGLVEKSPDPPSRVANAGIYGLPPGFAARLRELTESPRGELEVTDAVAAALAEGPWTLVRLKSWMDVGRPWDLLAASRRALENVTETSYATTMKGVTIQGPAHIEESALVKAGTYIEGPVWIGRNAVIGPNCYLRPYTVVGNGCKVGHAVEVKESVLMDGATVGHLSYVGDSVLGERVNFGAGTKVANLRHDERTVKVTYRGERVDTGRRKMGVIVGDDAHTGINTSLNVGVVLDAGDRTLPGEVVLRSRSGRTADMG